MFKWSRIWHRLKGARLTGLKEIGFLQLLNPDKVNFGTYMLDPGLFTNVVECISVPEPQAQNDDHRDWGIKSKGGCYGPLSGQLQTVTGLRISRKPAIRAHM